MIDDNKIAKAAFDLYQNSRLDFVDSNTVEGFKEGAKWMQEEFLKDLWHDVEEMPKRAKAFIFECGDYSMNYHVGMMFNPNDYKKNAEIWHMNRWCYLEDILPKDEGGEQ